MGLPTFAYRGVRSTGGSRRGGRDDGMGSLDGSSAMAATLDDVVKSALRLRGAKRRYTDGWPRSGTGHEDHKRPSLTRMTNVNLELMQEGGVPR